MKPLFHRRNLLYLWDPILGPFPASCRRGIRSWSASTSRPLPLRWSVSSLIQTYGSIDGFFSLFDSQYKVLLDALGDLFDLILFCGVFVEIRWIVDLWTRLSMNIILFFSELLYAWFDSKSLWIIGLVWPTRLIFLAMGEVLSFGFNLVVSFPSDSRGSKARIVLLPSRIKRWVLYHIAWVYPSRSCHLS